MKRRASLAYLAGVLATLGLCRFNGATGSGEMIVAGLVALAIGAVCAALAVFVGEVK